MAKAIPIVFPDTSHRLCTWHLMQNVVKHANSIFKDRGVEIEGVLSKFMYHIESKSEFKSAWQDMLHEYDQHDNNCLSLTFGVREKWGWPYVRSTWGAGMSSTQLSESFNAFLKDYIRSDHNLAQFFMHFERVSSDKRYKELEAEYDLIQKLPRLKMDLDCLKQTGDIYTNKNFEEFQVEYMKSIQASIKGCEHDGQTTVYRVRDHNGKYTRNVTKELDGYLSCNGRKFDMKGILCSHCLKVLREIMDIMDLPSQYILKRWTKKARAENVKDRHHHDIKANVKLHQTLRYRSLMAIFRAITCRASETEEIYNLSVSKADDLSVNIENMLHIWQREVSHEEQSASNKCLDRIGMDRADKANVIIAKGFKKKSCTSKGKRRIKSQLKLALGKSRQRNKRVKCMGCPPLVGRDVYVTQPMPSFTMGPINVSPQFTHPTHNASNMHNSMSVMHKSHASYVALPIQGPSGQALSLHGYMWR
ncbi:protein FAR1-RELATED SEQUENCE 5-like [Actinidia eriantha]|uniref:protein FAR1-RELATED SEQUENCE 5-like n=1 Tax=Actinidia eriantha TaxID=165200 RepID=UPI0025883775|nr:protein FAR1-RELATED SEQUENCE 5-like [Actinidia eriantha]